MARQYLVKPAYIGRTVICASEGVKPQGPGHKSEARCPAFTEPHRYDAPPARMVYVPTPRNCTRRDADCGVDGSLATAPAASTSWAWRFFHETHHRHHLC